MNTTRSTVFAAPPAQPGQLTSVEVANLRLLGEVRLVLAAVAMLVALVSTTGPARLELIAILAGYAALSVRGLRRLKIGSAGRGVTVNQWVDLACYMTAAGITGGIGSPFALFLLFPVFTACLRSGMRLGFVVALVCGAALAGMVSYNGELPGRIFTADSPVAQPVLGLVMAVVIARWAHTEITIVRRLAFCNDVSQVFTPQRGLRRAVSEFCQMLRAYHHAGACVVLLKDTRSAGWLLFQVDGGRPAVHGDALDVQVVQPLLVPAGNRAVLYRRRGVISTAPVCTAYDPSTLQIVDLDCECVAELAQLLEAKSLVSLPLQARDKTIGRLHLTTSGLSYTRNDVEFLAHVAAQVGVMIENMQLVDRLTMEVASEERKKISRDLHDGTIQPYIGLKLALEALHRKVAGDPVISHEVDDIIKMASDGISQLRHYVGHLKTVAQSSACDLLPAIRCQADKFSEYYGIRTEVVADTDIEVQGLLFEEIMHLVREGLSNIRRHTRARRVQINVCAGGGRLTLRFSNDTGPGQCAETVPFLPRSLSERARELGGRVDVDCSQSGNTVVSIEIPV